MKDARVYAYSQPRHGGKAGRSEIASMDGIAHAEAEVSRQRAMWDALVQAQRDFDSGEWRAIADGDAESKALQSKCSDIIAALEQQSGAYAARDLDKFRPLLTGLIDHAPAIEPELDQLRQRVDAVSAQIAEKAQARRDARQAAQGNIDTPELDKAIGGLADERRALRKELFPLLRKWRKDNQPLMAARNQLLKWEQKKIRNASGLYWGNYNRVADDFQSTLKRVQKIGRRPRMSDEERDDGVLTVQIQSTKSGSGALWSEVAAGKVPQIIITRSAGRMARLDMRCDADGHRFGMDAIIHREPAPHARIKSVQVTWKTINGERVYKLCLTLVSEIAEFEHPEKTAVGIDTGWRIDKHGGITVATVIDTDGKSERISLPAKWCDNMNKVDALGETIDAHAVELAQSWHNRMADLPEEFQPYLQDWNPRRGAKHIKTTDLHNAIRERLLSAADGERVELPDGFRHWYERYRHLTQMREGKRGRLIRQRREIYRLAAKQLADNNAIVALDKIDLAALAKTKQADDSSEQNKTLPAKARANRQRAALNIFHSELKDMAKKAGAQFVEIKGPTTLVCPDCGEKATRKAIDRMFACTSCGVVSDQDERAARNVLHAAIGARELG